MHRQSVALVCRSHEEMSAAAKALDSSQKLSGSITLVHVGGYYGPAPDRLEWPVICNILARCTNLDNLDINVRQSDKCLALLEALQCYSYDRLRHMAIRTDPMPAREFIRFLRLAPRLQSCVYIPPISDRLKAPLSIQPRTLRQVNIWLNNDGLLLPLVLSHQYTTHKLVLVYTSHLSKRLSKTDWGRAGSLSVRDLVIFVMPPIKDHAPLVAFALACRSLVRLDLRGKAADILQILQAVLTQPDCRLRFLSFGYARERAAPESGRPALALVRTMVGLRELLLYIHPRHQRAFEQDVAELCHFCRSRRIVFRMGISDIEF